MAGHDGELVRGVDAFDVEGRVGLRVAAGAAPPSSTSSKLGALVAHLGQDEVAGAVDDAGDPFDAVGGQALAQCLDDRDAARHRGLERHHHAPLLRRREDLVAMPGEQRLVGGDHVLAVLDRLQDQILRDLGAADQLDHDVDVGIAHDRERIGGHLGGAADDALGALQILVRDDLKRDGAAGAAGDFFLIAAQDRKRAAAYGADAQQADVDGSHHLNSLRNENEGMTKPSRK